MKSSTVTCQILINDEKVTYSPGDIIRGAVVVEAGVQCQVQNIDVMLRCHERTHKANIATHPAFLVNDLYNCYRAYSYRQTLFPPQQQKSGLEPTAIWGARAFKPRNTWNDDFHDVFSLKPGIHRFNFEVEIPADQAPSIRASSLNEVKWCLNAKIFKGSKLATACEAKKSIHVLGAGSLARNTDEVEETARPLPVVLYRNNKKSKDIVQLGVEIPRIGIRQEPHAAGLRVGIRGDAAEDLSIAHAAISLKRKVVCRIERLQFPEEHRYRIKHDTHKTEEVIYSKHMDLPCSHGIAAINDDIRKLQLHGGHAESFDSHCFDVSYKLVVLLTVYPREGPSTDQKLRLSVPVRILSSQVTVIDHPAEQESHNELPPQYEGPPASDSFRIKLDPV